MTRASPDFITFTGIDERTSLGRLTELSARYPIEWGVLMDPGRQGKDPRFPSTEALADILTSELRLAGHLCGNHADGVRNGELARASFDLSRFGRIQINSHKVSVAEAARFGRRIGRRCILPCGGDRFPESNAVDWLHDLSGGRGRETAHWPPHPGRLAGYAGGIGPDNAGQIVAAIAADGPYWIDMETRIRRDDWLDLDQCERVCVAVYGA
ncbi:phosphoribosylanthranilate isomerase [Kaistia algarum]|uniref:phosphoribosylanthranilate isomerase n=1 Tax=Kaistia algarum TaxID=2083279 RepID=UPI000CE911D9|nr:phosphoribosylanthranilate isomerase [Kaistia algarum]MCX5512029.1 phosphoribosylanthranilate isomerase [Kaistia algarum]PPE80154.1 phosphoribosylanthranilate isomerase [Kaistia algarum]